MEAAAAAAAQTSSRPDPAQEAPLSATDWCEAADDWGMEEDEGWGGGLKKGSKVQKEAAAPETQGKVEYIHILYTVNSFRPFKVLHKSKCVFLA